jgi:hypothetical protein
MEVVKCALLDNLMDKTTQHEVRKYALTIIFFSCIHFVLECDNQN